MCNHQARVEFSRLFSRFFFKAQASLCCISSWEWRLIDCTINLILWDKPLCILPPMSNKGWTAIYHWIRPITPPFTGVSKVRCSLCSSLHVTEEEVEKWGGPPSPWPSPRFIAKAGVAWGRRKRLFDRPALAPCAGHLCYKIPPSLSSGTPLSQPGQTKLWWIALLCYLVSLTAL